MTRVPPRTLGRRSGFARRREGRGSESRLVQRTSPEGEQPTMLEGMMVNRFVEFVSVRRNLVLSLSPTHTTHVSLGNDLYEVYLGAVLMEG